MIPRKAEFAHMRIAVLGAGNVGGTLGRAWLGAGHEVVFGVRDAGSVKEKALAAETGAVVVGLAEAVEGADVVVLAIPFRAVGGVLEKTGPLHGKVVVDTTNHLDWTYGLRVATERSAAEEIQDMIPTARIVKAFNTIGYEHMADPLFGDVPADMFVCGNDEAARSRVMGLAQDIGFEPVDAGGLSHARALEHLAVLWIFLSTSGAQGRDIAFKLLRTKASP
jgi:NADPH-dependent F420 reductase